MQELLNNTSSPEYIIVGVLYIILLVLMLELTVERRYRLRTKMQRKLGPLGTVICAAGLLLLTDTLARVGISRELAEHFFFDHSRYALFIYLLPRTAKLKKALR